jgi:hypothetical protein
VSARTADCVRRGGGGEGRRGEGGKLIRADGPMSARMRTDLAQVTSKRTLQCVQVTDAPAAIV